MTGSEGIVSIGIKGEILITSFNPNFPGDNPFEASSSVLPILATLPDEASNDIRAVAYAIGDEDPHFLREETLPRLKADLEARTEYKVRVGITKLSRAAVSGVITADDSQAKQV